MPTPLLIPEPLLQHYDHPGPQDIFDWSVGEGLISAHNTLFLCWMALPDENGFLVTGGNLFPKHPCVDPHSLIWAPFPDKSNLFSCLSALTSCQVVKTCIIWAVENKHSQTDRQWQVARQSGLSHGQGPKCLSLNSHPTCNKARHLPSQGLSFPISTMGNVSGDLLQGILERL